MTAEEAKANQEEIAKNYNLGWWYGVNCEKCCGVYPKSMRENSFARADCYYQCEVCGKRTAGYTMPWLSAEAWNNHEWINEYTQMSLF